MNEYRAEPLRAGDLPLLNSVKPGDWSSISEIHEHYLGTRSASCIKVVHDSGEIMGIGTALSFGQTGWIAHIIVAEKFRCHGLGTFIVKDRIDYLRSQRGCKTISLTATDYGYPVYRKIGFVDETMYRILVRPEGALFGGERDANIVRIEPGKKDEVIQLDRDASGEDRGEFLRPVLQRGFAYLEDNVVTGIYLSGFGDGGITARSAEAGIALLKERIKEPNKIFLPTENEAALEFLLTAGYTEVKQIHRMILGSPFDRDPRMCYSRIGGFAG